MSEILLVSLAGVITIAVVFFLIVSCAIVFLCVFPISLWWKAKSNGAEISISKLFAMKLKKANLNTIVLSYITAKKGGIMLDITDLETHVLAGGNIDNVVRAMIVAKNANLDLSLKKAMAIDLAGKNVFDIVQTCLTPKIIETQTITAITKDNVEIKARANITIKSVLKRSVGMADENTILMRASEALTSTIGSAINHKAVLENPDVISDMILQKNLDYETSYEILSIDIFNMEKGQDFGALKKLEEEQLKKKQMETEMERKRLEAVVKEQENKAKLQDAKIKAIETEAEVPRALAKALEEGKISPVDYYDIQNLQADTELRNKLCGKKSNVKDDLERVEKPRIKRNPFNF